MKKRIFLFFILFFSLSLNCEIKYEIHTKKLSLLFNDIKKAYSDYFKQELENTWKETDTFINELEQKNLDIFIINLAKDNNKIVGFAEFFKTKSNEEVYLDFIWVNPEYQRKSIGKNLIFSILKDNPNLTKISTYSDNQNFDAQLFFEKIGFKKYCITSDGITYKYYLENNDEIKHTKPIKFDLKLDSYEFIGKNGEQFKIEFNNILKNTEFSEDLFAKAFQPLQKEASINDYKNYWIKKCKNLKILKRFKENDILFFSAHIRDKMVGFSLFCPTSNREEIYLDYLAVDPDFQGSGLSKELIFGIFKKIPEINTINLYADQFNTKACTIYKHLGFEEFCKIPVGINFQFRKK